MTDMHYWGAGWFFGMHLLWWVFWIVLFVLLLKAFRSGPRNRSRETPLQILQRRYAAGELTTAEYEERKSRLDRDTGSS